MYGNEVPHPRELPERLVPFIEPEDGFVSLIDDPSSRSDVAMACECDCFCDCECECQMGPIEGR